MHVYVCVCVNKSHYLLTQPICRLPSNYRCLTESPAAKEKDVEKRKFEKASECKKTKERLQSCRNCRVIAELKCDKWKMFLCVTACVSMCVYTLI